EQVWQHTGEGGAKTSATLIPAIMALLREANVQLADLDAIVFGRGPGSFTGLRTACSVAQGLAFGADVKVLPIDTLLAVAEDARIEHGVNRVVAVLDARMGEVYSAAYAFEAGQWHVESEIQLGRPDALHIPQNVAAVGNFAPANLAAMPTATAMLRLAPAMLAAGKAVPADQALPLYVRDKVAQTTLEREAIKLQTSKADILKSKA
ncbi:MAG TPA: tRNA (adenosine(37)-N6)-threonylcarbamoyltransferase complex dimerization subunit type 1 TsaB, partial [Burkholderiaceae bacterium]|nr:tRNA (adenosine(37)-N6)-threonylcarbamoyltransferase complex dimerization subunit type 1 TsaB [Burkholderiaceae bacterium]